MVTCNIGKTGLTRNHIAGSIPESNFDSEMTDGTRGHSRPALRSLRSLRAVRSFCQPSAGRLDGQRVNLWHPGYVNLGILRIGLLRKARARSFCVQRCLTTNIEKAFCCHTKLCNLSSVRMFSCHNYRLKELIKLVVKHYKPTTLHILKGFLATDKYLFEVLTVTHFFM